jgi:DNA-binding CsgD family transcriptional regulator
MIQPAGAALLLERDSELTEIRGLVAEACGGRGRLVLIEGPPGIGKTQLLDAVRAEARDRGMAVLAGRASELDRDFPFGVVRQLFEPLVAAVDASRRDRLLAGAARLAAPLFNEEVADGTETKGGDPSLPRFHGLYWLTANLSDEMPAALVFDDAHWADVSSLRFLQFLLPRVEELPVLVALATRPPEPGLDRRPLDALATDALAKVVRPAPLSDSAVHALVTSELGAAAEPAFSDACHQATGGNPFFLRELIRQLAADEIAPSAAQAPVVRELTPPAVARTVLLRLARLGDDAAALARAVAVLGDAVPLHRACALGGVPSEHGAELAAALSQAHILRAEHPLAFLHPLLRSAIYGDIDVAERARAHRQAAALLADEGVGADTIAVHLLATEPARDPYIVATLRDAAIRALARGAAPAAVACLRRALREPPPADECGELMLELASAELRAGEPAAAVEHFDEGMRVTPDTRTRAARAGEHALALQAVGRDDDAFAVRERAVAEVADIEPKLAASLEGTLLGTARWDLARLDWGRDRLERYRERPLPDSPVKWRLLAFQAHLDAFSADRDDSADSLADMAERALGPLTHSDLRRGSPSTGFLGAVEVLVLADRNEIARSALDQALDAARRAGSAPGFAFTSAWRCLLLAREGALSDAEADARSCHELSLPQGWFSVAPMTLGFILDVLFDRGQLGDAERLLKGSGMAERTADHRLTFDPVVHARARMRAARGDVDAARSDLVSLRRRHARWNTYPTLSPPVLVAPELVDDLQEALAGAERMLKQARVWGTPRAIGMALRALGLVEGGPRGLDLLEEAARVLEPSPARLEYASALADLGAALRRANRRTAARNPLRQALDIADACGARLLAARARQELRAAGGRPRRTRVFGVQALTASERRIATMAAEGLSNPEIAQALFITKKTVEAHLSNAYRKLDIDSRAQLGHVLRDSAPRGERVFGPRGTLSAQIHPFRGNEPPSAPLAE